MEDLVVVSREALEVMPVAAAALEDEAGARAASMSPILTLLSCLVAVTTWVVAVLFLRPALARPALARVCWREA